MSWVVTAITVSAVGGYFSAEQQAENDAKAMAMNQANIKAAIGDIGAGKAAAEPYYDKIMKLAEQRKGEEGRVSADYGVAADQLESGYAKSMGRIAGAEGQMQDQMQAMMAQSLGGAIGSSPMAAMSGGSMGMNLARMAAGGVMSSGMPLELTKMAAGTESQYGRDQSSLTQAKSGATAQARELYLGGMQQANQSYADLEKWQANSMSSVRTGVQYQAAQAPNYAQGLDFDPLIDQYARNNP